MKTSSLSVLFAACCAMPAFGFEPDVIIDANDNPANVELSPSTSWINATSVDAAFRGASKYTNTSGSNQYARFHTTLPTAGPWQVFVWHNAGSSSSSALVTHADGATTVSYSQSSGNSGQWVLLGTYWFLTTAEAQVKLTAASNFSADAVRFSLATPDLVIDSSAATGVTLSPSNDWLSVNDRAANQGALRRSNLANATASFQPVLTASGDYEVSVWLPGGSGTWAGSIAVDVHGRGGAVTSHSVNLPAGGSNEGRWVQVGNAPFRFHATPPAGQPNPNPTKVVIKTGSGGAWVPADAVRFTKLGSEEVYMNENGSGVAVSPSPWGSGNSLMSQTYANFKLMPFGSTYRAEYFSSSNTTARSMTYTPTIGELGLYDIFLWYPGHNYSTSYNISSAKLTIHTAMGDALRTLNQRYSTGMWLHAGRYILNPSDHATPSARPWLMLSTPVNPFAYGTYSYYNWFSSNQGYIVADGVLFLKDGENLDTDQDGIMDWFEYLVGSGSGANDWDSDGIPDGDGNNDYNSLSAIYHPGGGPPVITVTAPSGAILY